MPVIPKDAPQPRRLGRGKRPRSVACRPQEFLARFFHALLPSDTWLDHIRLDPSAVCLDLAQHGLDQLVGEQTRTQAQFLQLGMGRVIVVLFLLKTRIGEVVEFDAEAQFGGLLADQLRQFEDAELLGELVVHAHFAARGGVEDAELDAAQGIADIQEPAGLPPFAVDGKRIAANCLHTEAVQGRAEDFVVVETCRQIWIERGLLGFHAVNDALIEIGGAQAPDSTGKVKIVAVVDLGEVIEGAGLLGKGEQIFPALVFNLNVALLDVNVGRAVFAHGAELDQVAVGQVGLHGPNEVQGADHVVGLAEDGAVHVHHRVGRGGLFAIVDDGIGAERLQHVGDNAVVAQIADEQLDAVAGYLLPVAHPVVQGADGQQGLNIQFHFPAAFAEVIEHGDLVTALGKVHGGGPTEVAVAAEDKNAHGSKFSYEKDVGAKGL